MPDNVKPVKGIGFTEEERKLCIKALRTYQKVDMELYLATGNRLLGTDKAGLPFLPPSEDERETIDLLIDDFKGPQWSRGTEDNTPLGDNFPATGQMTFDYFADKEENENQTNAQD